MSITASTPEQISFFRLAALKGALKLETVGMKRRGRSAYAIVKEEFGFRGSKKNVLSQLEELIEELNAYNPLIPQGRELIATLMFEIDNLVSRTAFLNKVGEIEKKIYIKIDSEKIDSIPEQDVNRTSEEGKASSIQFIHFNSTGQ